MTQNDHDRHIIYEQQLFQRVLYILYKCSTLQELFIKWEALPVVDKLAIDYCILATISKSKRLVYSAFMKAFVYWNCIQDREGACGFNEDPLGENEDIEDENCIYWLSFVVNNIIQSLKQKREVLEEVKTFDKKSLKGPKIKVMEGNGDEV